MIVFSVMLSIFKSFIGGGLATEGSILEISVRLFGLQIEGTELVIQGSRYRSCRGIGLKLEVGRKRGS